MLDNLSKILSTVFLFSLFTPGILRAQKERKELTAVRAEVPPRIDGYMDDEIWSSANEARDFYQYIP